MRFIAFFAIIASVSATSVDLCTDDSCSTIDHTANGCGITLTAFGPQILSAHVRIDNVSQSVALIYSGDCTPDGTGITVPGPTKEGDVCDKCVKLPAPVECVLIIC